MSKDFLFKLNVGGLSYSVEKYLGDSQVVDIPDVYKQKPVTSVEKYAFSCCGSIEVVNFPDTIKSIDRQCFFNCSSLETVNFNEGLELIDFCCFNRCRKIKELVFPSTLKSIGNNAFDGNVALTDITFLSENVEFNKNIFHGCTAIRKINFCYLNLFDTHQAYKISEYIIQNFDTFSADEQQKFIQFIKRKLTVKREIYYSNNITNISFLIENNITIKLDELNKYLEHSISKNRAEITTTFLNYKSEHFSDKEIADFEENRDLVEIGIEVATLKQMREKWFISKIDGEFRITGYKGKNTTETIPEFFVDSKGNKLEIKYISYMNNKTFEPIENLVIEAKIVSISMHYCSTLRSVRLPESLTTIEYSAFAHCNNLKEINIPESVNYIGNYAFYFCTALENIVLPENLTYLGYYGFCSCTSLKNIVIPNRLTDILDSVFEFCESLTEITIHDNVDLIATNAFHNCKNLVNFRLPKRFIHHFEWNDEYDNVVFEGY